MADTVRYLMEEMVPELEELEQKGYFSRKEVKQIVQRRQEFEYQLKRRAALKQDYYRYIEYETKLEDLRQLRKRKLRIKDKKGLTEIAAVRRIHFIYERCTRKFKADLDLWLRWIAFCKASTSSKQLSKVLTKALQRHSNVPLLWVEAAVWEFEAHSNMTAARALMQQGLRMCKGSADMWIEYFRFELLYAARLRARRQVLGLGSAVSEEDPEAESAVKAVLSGAVAGVVFRQATAALPDDLGLHAQALTVLRNFTFEGVEQLRGAVYASIEKDFAQARQSEEAWDLLAQRHLSSSRASSSQAAAGAEGSDAEDAEMHEASGEQQAAAGTDASMHSAQAHDAACTVYASAIKAVPTTRMYEQYCGYLYRTLQLLHGQGPSQLEECVRVATLYFSVMQSAHAAGVASPDMYMQWSEFATSLGQNMMALKAARAACQRHPGSARVWALRLPLELAAARTASPASTSASAAALSSSSSSSSTGGDEKVLCVFRESFKALAVDAATHVWSLALDSFPPNSPSFMHVCNELVGACARAPAADAQSERGRVALKALTLTWNASGPEAARSLCRRLAQCPALGADFYRGAVELEEAALPSSSSSSSSGAEGNAKGSRKAGSSKQAGCTYADELFEVALREYGECEADLWLRYIGWHMRTGRADMAGTLFWRASKALQDPGELAEGYKQLLQE